jgi:hypothetical protein
VRTVEREGGRWGGGTDRGVRRAETVYDLWNPGSGSLQVREYPPGYWRGFYVEDLYVVEATTREDLLFLLWEGSRVRAVGAHKMNKDSSRSHSMLTLYLESEQEIKAGEISSKFGKVSFVDLAGSERLRETQGDLRPTEMRSAADRSRAEGDAMLKETGNINKSLFTLGKVMPYPPTPPVVGRGRVSPLADC